MQWKVNNIRKKKKAYRSCITRWETRCFNEGKRQTRRETRRQGSMTGSQTGPEVHVGRTYRCGPVCQWRQFQRRVASWGTLPAPRWNGQQRERRVGSRCLHAHSLFSFPWWAGKSLRDGNRDKEHIHLGGKKTREMDSKETNLCNYITD